MAAAIQFMRGTDEEIVPDVRVTRAKDGTSGRAVFYFDNPKIVQEGNLEIMGMYMVDDEGELITREVNAIFVNGKATAIEAIHTMRSADDFERFRRFMERYSESHGLGFNKS
jgi:photosystem II 13kDa protein